MYNKYDYWFELAEYDLETAKAMLTTRRVLYVGFMCQQTIEKSLKGLYVLRNPGNSVSLYSKSYNISEERRNLYGF